MISVGEALLLSELNHALVRAGKKGLFRKIRWAHIIEHVDMRHFLEGGELLLTSGQIWPKDEEAEEKLLKGFLQHQISGILFATGHFLEECPPSVIEFGEKYDIPILEVPFHVPFVKLIHSIHKEIMKREFRNKELTAKLPFELIEKFKSTKTGTDVCKLLTAYFNCPAVITDSNNKILAKTAVLEGKRINFPQIIDKLTGSLKQELLKNKQQENELVLPEVKTIHVSTEAPPYALAVRVPYGSEFRGTIWLLGFQQPFEEVHARALEYAATILFDIFLNQQEDDVNRKQLKAELMELLFENPKTASIVMEDKVRRLGLLPNNNWIAGVILTGKKENPFNLSAKMELWSDECIHWIDKAEGIDGFCEIYQGQLTLLISSNLSYPEIKLHLKNLYDHLKQTFKQEIPVLVFGELKNNLLSLAESYRESKLLTPLVQYLNHDGGVYFAADFRGELMLYGGMNPNKAQQFRNLILPKQILSERGSVLYETLKCLAAHNFNRETAAKSLHIHRNTLRYRIERIEQYLGNSLSSTKCQFWIQVALDLESLANQDNTFLSEAKDRDNKEILPF